MGQSNYNFSFTDLLSFFSFMFILSSMSLMGFPYLAGFFSKDYMLESCYGYNNMLFSYIVLVMSCVLTSIYSFRLIFICMKTYSSTEKMFFMSNSSNLVWMIFLFFWSIFLGKFFCQITLSMNMFMYNSVKLSSVFILLTGFALASNSIWLKLHSFMNLLTDMIMLKFFFSSYFSNTMILFDQSLNNKWLELVGPLGIFESSIKINFSFFFNKMTMINYLLIMVLLFFILV